MQKIAHINCKLMMGKDSLRSFFSLKISKKLWEIYMKWINIFYSMLNLAYQKERSSYLIIQTRSLVSTMTRNQLWLENLMQIFRGCRLNIHQHLDLFFLMSKLKKNRKKKELSKRMNLLIFLKQWIFLTYLHQKGHI